MNNKTKAGLITIGVILWVILLPIAAENDDNVMLVVLLLPIVITILVGIIYVIYLMVLSWLEIDGDDAIPVVDKQFPNKKGWLHRDSVGKYNFEHNKRELELLKGKINVYRTYFEPYDMHYVVAAFTAEEAAKLVAQNIEHTINVDDVHEMEYVSTKIEKPEIIETF